MRKPVPWKPSGPFQLVKSTAHRLGFRFRLGGCGLPGQPHLVFPIHRLAMFVCSCKEYGHDCQPPRVQHPKCYFEVQRRLANADLAIFRRVLEYRGWRTEAVFGCATIEPAAFERRLPEIIIGQDVSRSG